MEDIKPDEGIHLSNQRCAIHAATQLHLKEEIIKKVIKLQRTEPVKFGGTNPPVPSRTITIKVTFAICPVPSCGLVYNLKFPEQEEE